MGLRDWWQARHMTDPVAGVFRKAGHYRRGSATILTGVIVADGLPPAPIETPADFRGKWLGTDELPVLVDRADPRRFVIKWDQVEKYDPRAEARYRAQEAASQLSAGVPSDRSTPFDQPGPPPRPVNVDLAGGDMGALVEQAMRAVGMDPALPGSVNVNMSVQSGVGFGGVRAGTPTTAVVTTVQEAVPPVPLPAGMSMVDLILEVSGVDGSTYLATVRITFSTPERRAAVAVPGRRLPVLVNSANPARIAIDMARFDLS